MTDGLQCSRTCIASLPAPYQVKRIDAGRLTGTRIDAFCPVNSKHPLLVAFPPLGAAKTPYTSGRFSSTFVRWFAASTSEGFLVGREIKLDTAFGRHIDNEQSEEITRWDLAQYTDLDRRF